MRRTPLLVLSLLTTLALPAMATERLVDAGPVYFPAVTTGAETDAISGARWTVSGAVTTQVDVTAYDIRYREFNPRIKESDRAWVYQHLVQAHVQQYTSGPILLDAIAYDITGEHSDYSYDRNLRSSRATGTLVGIDGISHTPVTITVDVDWSATGRVVHDTAFDRTFGDLIYRLNSNFASCEASASGNVSIGSVNYTPGPSSTGAIGTAHYGELYVQRASASPSVPSSDESSSAPSSWGRIKQLYR